MVIYFRVKFEFDWTQRFRVRIRKRNFDGQTNRQETDKRTDGITPISKGTWLWWWSISLSSLNSIGQTVFELESGNGNFDGQMDKKRTNRRNYTNFERNLAVMVIYFPVKFEFDWTNCFRVRVRKRKFWRTNGQKTDKQTELHQFRKEPSGDGDLFPCQVWIRLDKPFSS